jgi:hypothetical protein
VLDEVKTEPTCRQLMTVPGVGPLNALAFRRYNPFEQSGRRPHGHSDSALTLARLAGLDLPVEFHGDLLSAYERLQGMLARMPRRERTDEPAHIFDPLRSMPPSVCPPSAGPPDSGSRREAGIQGGTMAMSQS